MGQYVEFKLMINSDSEDVPDFGLGKGVLVTQRVVLDDDDHTAAYQIIKISERLREENIKVITVPITEEEYNK